MNYEQLIYLMRYIYDTDKDKFFYKGLNNKIKQLYYVLYNLDFEDSKVYYAGLEDKMIILVKSDTKFIRNFDLVQLDQLDKNNIAFVIFVNQMKDETVNNMMVSLVEVLEYLVLFITDGITKSNMFNQTTYVKLISISIIPLALKILQSVIIGFNQEDISKFIQDIKEHPDNKKMNVDIDKFIEICLSEEPEDLFEKGLALGALNGTTKD